MTKPINPDKPPLIYTQLRRVLNDIGQIEAVTDITAQTRSLFIAHGITLMSEILEHSFKERVSSQGIEGYHHIMRIRWKFVCLDDGSELESVTSAEAWDPDDGGSIRAYGRSLEMALFAFGFYVCELDLKEKPTFIGYQRPPPEPPPSYQPPAETLPEENKYSPANTQARQQQRRQGPPHERVPPRRTPAQTPSEGQWKAWKIPFGDLADTPLYEAVQLNPKGVKKLLDWYLTKKKTPPERFLKRHNQEIAFLRAAVAYIEQLEKHPDPESEPF